MCLVLLIPYTKAVLQAILFLTVLSNCVSVSPNFDSDFLLDCTKFYIVFYIVG